MLIEPKSLKGSYGKLDIDSKDDDETCVEKKATRISDAAKEALES